jgi:hypothetical protein
MAREIVSGAGGGPPADQLAALQRSRLPLSPAVYSVTRARRSCKFKSGSLNTVTRMVQWHGQRFLLPTLLLLSWLPQARMKNSHSAAIKFKLDIACCACERICRDKLIITRPSSTASCRLIESFYKIIVDVCSTIWIETVTATGTEGKSSCPVAVSRCNSARGALRFHG